MRVALVAVGKLKRSPLQAPFDDYITRLSWPVAIHEIASAKGPTPAKRREIEATKLQQHTSSASVVVALDKGGRDLTSESLAVQISDWQVSSRADVAFIIGGPDGLDDALRRRADLTLAFGEATWPHLLVRVMLAEQLYRAASILAGHPYHHGDPA
jgi:23S rRNA (pseudouridine1915-N3)-methyltransferase